jgi:hypothetical protein
MYQNIYTKTFKTLTVFSFLFLSNCTHGSATLTRAEFENIRQTTNNIVNALPNNLNANDFAAFHTETRAYRTLLNDLMPKKKGEKGLRVSEGALQAILEAQKNKGDNPRSLIINNRGDGHFQFESRIYSGFSFDYCLRHDEPLKGDSRKKVIREIQDYKNFLYNYVLGIPSHLLEGADLPIEGFNVNYAQLNDGIPGVVPCFQERVRGFAIKRQIMNLKHLPLGSDLTREILAFQGFYRHLPRMAAYNVFDGGN